MFNVVEFFHDYTMSSSRKTSIVLSPCKFKYKEHHQEQDEHAVTYKIKNYNHLTVTSSSTAISPLLFTTVIKDVDMINEVINSLEDQHSFLFF